MTERFIRQLVIITEYILTSGMDLTGRQFYEQLIRTRSFMIKIGKEVRTWES